MKFLADESCDFGVVRTLPQSGHDVLAVCEVARRLEDPEIMDLAVREDRILVTEDKDFGQLAFAHGHGSRGVILLRYPASARRRLFDDVVRLVEQKDEALRGSFVALEPGRFHVARLPRGI